MCTVLAITIKMYLNQKTGRLHLRLSVRYMSYPLAVQKPGHMWYLCPHAITVIWQNPTLRMRRIFFTFSTLAIIVSMQ